MPTILKSLLFLVPLLSAWSAASEDHDHDEEHWEWAGLFKVESSESTRNTFELRNSGLEEDPVAFRAAFFITSCAGEDSESFEAAEEIAEEYFESAEMSNSATQLSGSHVTLNVDQVYELSYSNESWVTAVNIRFPSDGYYVMFTGHHPSELCGFEDYHTCFREQTGEVVTILMEEGGHDDHDEDTSRSTGEKWMYTLVGCFLCWIVVFSGLIFMVCGAKKYQHFTENYLHLMNLFASGAILATVMLLILIEAYHFIDSVDSFSEPQVAGTYGAAILAGFISPTIIELLVFRGDVVPEDIISNNELEIVEEIKMSGGAQHKGSRLHADHTHQVSTQVIVCDEEADLSSLDVGNAPDCSPDCTDNHRTTHQYHATADREAPEEDPTSLRLASPPLKHDVAKVPINSIIISILCGDFLHNFCDGIFIGVAVKSCSLSLLWTIVLATMFHEFAQEISDFVILTNQVGLSIPKALTLNAIGGFSIVLGGILTNVCELSDLMIGVFLAYGSGNLIYLSAGELFPLLHVPPTGKAKLTNQDKLYGVLSFCVGAFVIGLTLLKHEHCEDSGVGEHAHDH